MKSNVGSFGVLAILAALAAMPVMASEDTRATGANAPVSTREIQQLEFEIAEGGSSTLEGVGEFHTESGDLNNRLDFLRYGLKVNCRSKAGFLYYVRTVGTSYLTTDRYLDARGVNFTGGVQTELREGVKLRVEAGATRFTTDATSVNAAGSLEVRGSSGTEFYLKGTRTNVEESLLSATGIRPVTGPFAGKLVGLVMDNRGIAGVRQRLTQRLDVFAEGGGGARNGRNIESNLFKTASAGAGFNIFAVPDYQSVNLVRASYSLEYFGFSKDLLGYGGASLVGRSRPMPLDVLGSDGVSPLAYAGHPGTGGYFSPADYVSNVGRLEIQGRPRAHFGYTVSGFAGAQDYTGSRSRLASGASVSVIFHLSDRYSLPVTYVRDNFGPFTQQSVFFKLVARL